MIHVIEEKHGGETVGVTFESTTEEESKKLKRIRESLEKQGIKVKEMFYGDGFTIGKYAE